MEPLHTTTMYGSTMTVKLWCKKHVTWHLEVPILCSGTILKLSWLICLKLGNFILGVQMFLRLVFCFCCCVICFELMFSWKERGGDLVLLRTSISHINTHLCTGKLVHFVQDNIYERKNSTTDVYTIKINFLTRN